METITRLPNSCKECPYAVELVFPFEYETVPMRLRCTHPEGKGLEVTKNTKARDSECPMEAKLEENPVIQRCPFCGGEAELRERYIKGVANKKHYHIRCKACGCGQDVHRDYATKAKAIRAWNKRYDEA